ncbi:MAG: hypothetical protein V1778_03585 [bacterium]
MIVYRSLTQIAPSFRRYAPHNSTASIPSQLPPEAGRSASPKRYMAYAFLFTADAYYFSAMNKFIN